MRHLKVWLKSKAVISFPHLLSAQDVQRDETVRELVNEAAELNNRLKGFKRKCEEMIITHVALVNDTVDPTPRDLSGQYETLDGSEVFEVDYVPIAPQVAEKVAQLKGLLRAALDELGEGLDRSMVAMIKAFLRVDGRSVDLRQLERNRHQPILLRSSSWREAMELLPDCTVVNGYHPYFRFFRVSEDGTRTPVLRNFSAISTGQVVMEEVK